MSGSSSSPGADRRLPRAGRLVRRSDFDRVYQQGRKVVDRTVVAFLLPAPPAAGRWRLGLSVSVKVGHSPRRNRVKRVLREAFRQSAPPPPAHDLILIARPGVAPDTLADAREALARVLQRGLRSPILPRVAPPAAAPSADTPTGDAEPPR